MCVYPPTPAGVIIPLNSPTLSKSSLLWVCVWCDYHFKLPYCECDAASILLVIAQNSARPALLEKQSKFPRYNMKCRGKPDTTWNIPRSFTFSPLHFMLYRGKSITFGTVWKVVGKLLESRPFYNSGPPLTLQGVPGFLAPARTVSDFISYLHQ